MGRSPCCDKANVKRGPWSPQEDTTLKNYIQANGFGGNWISLPHKAGLNRCGKSCRLRWLNYLRPNIKHGGFTQEEDNIICNLYKNIGSRWSVIASQLQERTDNDVKNHWNTKLKKKFLADENRTVINNSTSKPEQTYYCYSFSTNSTHPYSLNRIPSSSSTSNGTCVGFLPVVHVPTPMEEFGSSSTTVNNSSANQEVSVGHSSVSSSVALDNNNNVIPWSGTNDHGGGGDEEFDSFLMDFGFGDLLNSFGSEDKLT